MDLSFVLQQYYYELYELWDNSRETDLLSNSGNGLRMPISKIKEIFKLFPEMSPKSIINNTDHYSGWYGTMGHMAIELNEPETYQFLIGLGLDTSIPNYYGSNAEWQLTGSPSQNYYGDNSESPSRVTHVSVLNRMVSQFSKSKGEINKRFSLIHILSNTANITISDQHSEVEINKRFSLIQILANTANITISDQQIEKMLSVLTQEQIEVINKQLDEGID